MGVEDIFHRKTTTKVHRVAARHYFPFRLSNRPKKTNFQATHPSPWHKQARDTRVRSRTRPPRERASKMRKIHGPLVCKTRRGGTRGPGTYPPKKWHKGVTSRLFPRLAECHELGMGLTPTDDWTDHPFECSCWNACWMSGTSTLSFPFGLGCSWEHSGTYTRLQGGATQACSTKGRNDAPVESTHERDPWEIRRHRSCETIPELRWEIEPEDKRRRRDQTVLATEAVQSRDRSRGSEPSPRQVGKMSFLFKSKRSPAEAVQKLQAGFDELESGNEKVRTTDSDIVTEQGQERRRWKEKD